MAKTVILKIKRQENPKAKARWEEFELTWKPGMNVISAMMEIAANSVTRGAIYESRPTSVSSNSPGCTNHSTMPSRGKCGK